MIYCFDTSGLIQTWNDLYPRDTFPSLWDNIDALVDKQRIVSPDEVLRELSRQDDDLHAWAKARPGMFIKTDGSFLKKGVEIINRYPRMLDQKPGKNGADPWVVALALDRGATVVTEEKPNGNMVSPKIPTVCRAEGVRHMNVLEFIQSQQWKW